MDTHRATAIENPTRHEPDEQSAVRHRDPRTEADGGDSDAKADFGYEDTILRSVN